MRRQFERYRHIDMEFQGALLKGRLSGDLIGESCHSSKLERFDSNDVLDC